MGEEPGASVSAALESLRVKELIYRHESSQFEGDVELRSHTLFPRCHVRERFASRLRGVASRGRELARRSERQRGSVRRGDRRSLRAGGRPGRCGGMVRPCGPARARRLRARDRGRVLPAGDRFRLGGAGCLWANPAGDGGSSGIGAWRRLSVFSRFDDAIDAYEKMRAAAAASGDKVAEARAWNGRGFIEQRKGDYQGLLASAEGGGAGRASGRCPGGSDRARPRAGAHERRLLPSRGGA